MGGRQRKIALHARVELCDSVWAGGYSTCGKVLVLIKWLEKLTMIADTTWIIVQQVPSGMFCDFFVDGLIHWYLMCTLTLHFSDHFFYKHVISPMNSDGSMLCHLRRCFCHNMNWWVMYLAACHGLSVLRWSLHDGWHLFSHNNYYGGVNNRLHLNVVVTYNRQAQAR